MKGKTVRLREAHKNSGGASCSVIWDNDEGKFLVTAASSDTAVAVHDLASTAQRTLCHHRDGVTCLAINPNSSSLASGSIDHSVKLYGFPSGDFQSNVTRFTLPIRCLAFNRSGSLLAAAGDDDGIKLIATVDSSISRVLKGHRGTVTGLDFDPKNEFLASVDSVGTVIYWELSTGEAVHTLKSIAPDRESDGSILNVVSWRPDGEVLAIPGLKNDVVMHDRDTSEKVFSLKGDHEDSVCFFSWSMNGKYMATAGADRQVLIWDVDLKQDIERQKFEERISSLAWKPKGNALAVIDCKGKFGIWETPVPSFMKSPSEDVPVLKTTNQASLFFDEDDENDNSSESVHDAETTRHKRLRRSSKVVDDHEEEYDDGEEDDLLHAIESREKRRSKRRTEARESSRALKPKDVILQAAFQPCSTPEQSGKRRFLCYNMLGTVTTMENEGYAHIEVDFHDTGRGSRVPAMTDFFGFTMASLNESGSVFANPCRGEKSTSTLLYRPFSSWANNSEWSMRFEAEEVKVVALGAGWVAAVTDLNFLRIFSEGGLQRHIISLNGPVVTAVGFKDELAVVTHASEPLPSGDQMVEVRVFNMASGTQPIRCPVPLSPGSTLSWFGFSEEGQLSSCDSHGVLRVFTNQFSGSWLPLFRAKDSEEEIYWVVGLNATKLFCVVCKPPEPYPVVSPKPVLTVLDLSFPVVLSDLGASNLENEFIMCSYQLSLARTRLNLMMKLSMWRRPLTDVSCD
ncbi:transducin family protein / WD-40 repeat family protein isoform X2 [Wolffia australiana]